MSLSIIRETVPSGSVEGYAETRFLPVLNAFLENFRERSEVGAALVMYHKGRLVMDVWGGAADARAGTPWSRDTIVPVYSCTKAALAIMAHMLIDRGELGLDDLVTEVWPEYGANGKENTTVRMILDHSSGLPALLEQLPQEAFLDWGGMVERLQQAKPLFEPGTRCAYQGYTHAWLVGELIHRASGCKPSVFMAEEIARPLGLDFWIGLPDTAESRLAKLTKPLLANGAKPTPFMKALSEKRPIPTAFANNDGGFRISQREYRVADIASANGICDARSLARIYAPLSLGGKFEGVRLVSQNAVSEMVKISNASHRDETLCSPLRYSSGFMRTVFPDRLTIAPQTEKFIPDTAFGHGGAGGSLGFADPSLGIGFGYVMNQMGISHLVNDRGQALIDALYGVLS
jgi:CubicO group peptidase (beta-lactamase class C family)